MGVTLDFNKNEYSSLCCIDIVNIDMLTMLIRYWVYIIIIVIISLVSTSSTLRYRQYWYMYIVIIVLISFLPTWSTLWTLQFWRRWCQSEFTSSSTFLFMTISLTSQCRQCWNDIVFTSSLSLSFPICQNRWYFRHLSVNLTLPLTRFSKTLYQNFTISAVTFPKNVN